MEQAHDNRPPHTRRRPELNAGASWKAGVVVAVVAATFVLSLSEAPAVGIVCARLELPRSARPQVDVGSRSLCRAATMQTAPTPDASARRLATVTLGLLGRAAYFHVEPAEVADESHREYHAVLGALKQGTDGIPVIIFRWETVFRPPLLHATAFPLLPAIHRSAP